MKTLILYYSYGGNTRKIARMLQQEIGADLEEIETVKPYTGSYNDIVDQGQREINSGFMPEIKPLKVDVSGYDRIVLGSPVWWYTFAPAMKSFLHNNDLSGKSIYPYATNGGWIGHTFEDFERDCKDAKVQKGLNIRFDEKQLLTSEKEIKKWINSFS
jgi:flavodoxin